MKAPVLFGMGSSVYTRIARLALAEKGTEYTFKEVDIFGPSGVPGEHFARHPFGRIPTLEHDGFMLYETGAITRYVDEAFPGVPLQPAAPRARARMNQIISLLDAYAYRPMVWSVFVQRIAIPRTGGTADEAIIAEALPNIATCLEALEGFLGIKRFFTGDEVSLADLHAAPILLYFSLTNEGRKLLMEHVRLNLWLSGFSKRRSVAETQSIYG